MKTLLSILSLFVTYLGSSQEVGVYFGKNLLPANYFAIQYSFPSNYTSFFSVKGFYESSRQFSLQYASYGATFLVNLSFPRSTEPVQTLHFRLGAGSVIRRLREAWLLPQHAHFDVGAVLDVSAHLPVSSVFSFSFFGEQRWFLPKTPIRDQVVLGIGLRYRLNYD